MLLITSDTKNRLCWRAHSVKIQFWEPFQKVTCNGSTVISDTILTNALVTLIKSYIMTNLEKGGGTHPSTSGESTPGSTASSNRSSTSIERTQNQQYAGFWMRAAAIYLDVAIVFSPLIIIPDLRLAGFLLSVIWIYHFVLDSVIKGPSVNKLWASKLWITKELGFRF